MRRLVNSVHPIDKRLFEPNDKGGAVNHYLLPAGNENNSMLSSGLHVDLWSDVAQIIFCRSGVNQSKSENWITEFVSESPHLPFWAL